MILWLNGAFGAGKTQVAHELSRRLGGRGWVADPEHLGYAIRRMTPPGRRDEFQRHPEWRRAVIGVLDELHATEADVAIIVPQALLDAGQHAEIIGGLRDRGHRVEHVTLVAGPRTLARRLRARGELHRTWAHEQIGRCVTALQDPRFAAHLSTDGRTIDEVVEAVAACAGLQLVRPRLPAGVHHTARLMVTLRHVRRIG